MVKKTFDTPLHTHDKHNAQQIIDHALQNNVTTIINVGTSLIESNNCIMLAQWFAHNYAVVGIHPNDCTTYWQKDLQEIKTLLRKKEDYKIVGIGECGLDFHYPDYNKQRQYDAFKAQIDCALAYDLALVVHTRDARDETLYILEPYKHDITRGIIHCFSEDLDFAQQVISWGFAIGMGGAVTYPKNNNLREVARGVNLSSIVLETDAPFLPPQSMRGKQNTPSSIALIAQYLAELLSVPYETIAQETTSTAKRVFKLP